MLRVNHRYFGLLAPVLRGRRIEFCLVAQTRFAGSLLSGRSFIAYESLLCLIRQFLECDSARVFRHLRGFPSVGFEILQIMALIEAFGIR